jgi:hypothetical protein
MVLTVATVNGSLNVLECVFTACSIDVTGMGSILAIQIAVGSGSTSTRSVGTGLTNTTRSGSTQTELIGVLFD